ncbi:DNA packaging protein [Paenibacillus ihbetae]|uniref:DNA packaging protein n=1 Tax=Paenibacillus ihbetae TaxID=1870820 RepID=A0A1B2DVF5_9BACL|nr:head-tail connector protein [Paenibacillus ihbetae]ANY71661.1 DNA packaging protein [Paenibacillus ihbetae]
MAILTLDETKLWLRVDGNDEDAIIQTLMGAAETYLGNAVEVQFDSTNQLAKLFCLVLCADWYENRELIGSQPSDKVRFTCQSIMTQLQNAYGPPEYEEG